MDCADLIEQLVVVESRRAAGEDDDAAAGECTINDMANALRSGRNGNVLLLEHVTRRILLDMRRRQLHLDDVRAELSRDLDGIADHIDPGFAFLAQARSAWIGPDDDREPVALCFLGVSAELSIHFKLMCRSRIDREAHRAAA